MSDEDLYVILGLSRTATERAIQRAFRKLTRKCHPLVNPGDKAAESDYHRLCQVYEVLGDTRRRAEYDRLGHREFTRRSEEMKAVPVRGEEEFLTEAVREGFIGDILGLRPKTATGELPRRGEDIRHYLGLTFFQAAKGHETTVDIVRRVLCPTCGGAGTATGSRRDVCTRCRGTGITSRSLGPLVTERECAVCRGRGYLIRKACGVCRGAGRLEKRVEVKVRIPAGVISGSEIRVRGLGHDGEVDSPPGDLLIITRVEEHPRFARKGDTVYSTYPLMVWQAALGGQVTVTTLDGKVALAVPPGTQAGQQFRLSGRGIPNLMNGRRGDHVVEMRVIIPAPEDEASRKAWRKIAQLAPAQPGKEAMELSPGDKIK